MKSVRYKSARRGAYRILIQTDRKIYMETGMMKNGEEAEKLIRESGKLSLPIFFYSKYKGVVLCLRWRED